MFGAAFLANLCNNLTYILCRKFPICFALPFLTNLSKNLSSILYRKFPVYFKPHVFPILYRKYDILDKCCLNRSKKHVEKSGAY